MEEENKTFGGQDGRGRKLLNLRLKEEHDAGKRKVRGTAWPRSKIRERHFGRKSKKKSKIAVSKGRDPPSLLIPFQYQ